MGSLKVSHSFVQELLSRVDIVDIVSHYIDLKQSGRNFKALCPFHPEKTPSFVVSPEKQIFKCFGCGVGGNAITFVEKYENLPFWEAVKRVAEIAGIELPKDAFREDSKELHLEETAYRVAKYFNSKLETVLNYLKERGISKETADRFLLGYAPPGYLRELNLKREEAELLGLVGKNGKEFFKGRLIIPIFNHSGKVVSFAGRVLNGGDGAPKYINGPETELFKKSNLLYGFYQAKEEVLRKREIIVVEGYFDVISLYQAGVRRAVAPMGTSLTENHARFIKRYSPSPVLLFDADSAGRKATLRAAQIFFSLGCEPRVVQLPDGEDPDSMARSRLPELLALLESPQPFIKWAVAVASALSREQQALFLKEVGQAIAPLERSNPFLYREYLALLAAEFGIDESWLKVRVAVRRQESHDNGISPPLYEKLFIKALVEGKGSLPIEVSPNIFISPVSARLYTLLSSGGTDPVELQLQFPDLADYISELMLLEVTDADINRSLCRVAIKELKRRLKKVKDFSRKVELKRLIFRLERGELEALHTLQTT